jgi:hypothetical protein
MKRITSIALSIVLVITVVALSGGQPWDIIPAAANTAGNQVDIVGPSGSESFGTVVVALPNGNIVVTDPSYDNGLLTDVGAVYLYNGATRALISTLTGSTPSDAVGSGGVVELENGNYVVLSSYWNSDTHTGVGAATWGSMTTGVSGVISDANSLVGSNLSDQVGIEVVALTNGNYVVLSPYWNSDTNTGVGAATWGNGSSGTTGVVSSVNSLIGSRDGDMVGSGYITENQKYPGAFALLNGNYVVHSSYWDNDSVVDAGAVSWGNGSSGTSGEVSVANSLVGTTTNDLDYVTVISLPINGNYVVGSGSWDNTDTGATNAGAVTWGGGATGISGEISATTSLIGETSEDWVGDGVVALVNGNYVVCSGVWDSPLLVDAGASTWANGTIGITGTIDDTNSLVGGKAGDRVGQSARALTNGHYVVISPYWDSPSLEDVGAVTWVNGTTGATGAFDGHNSMIGNSADDRIGLGGVAPLSNGNYVISSRLWDNPDTGAADAGAATWVSGAGPVTGEVAVIAANSLVGSQAEDHVGFGVTALTNGNYVVRSTDWDNGSEWSAGAATWGNGETGTIGVVSQANSLVGLHTIDQVGWNVLALTNGNYVVNNHLVDVNGMVNAGAVTWGNGLTGRTGVVSNTNSLVGSTAFDDVGEYKMTTLDNGDYIFISPNWDNGSIVDVGAVTWGDGTRGSTGRITRWNSVLGGMEFVGGDIVYDFNNANDQLVVGRPDENLVTLFRPSYPAFMPLIKK